MEPILQQRIQRYGWDIACNVYDKGWEDQLKASQDRLIEIADPQQDEQVVDVACGTGLVTFPIAEKVGANGHVLGTDISEKMLEIVNRLAGERGIENCSFQRSEAENMKLPKNSFDLAICSLGLMYFSDPDRALAEMQESLVKGGRTAVSVWGNRGNCGWSDVFPIVDKRVETEVCPMFFQLGTGDALEYALENAGFEDVRIERFSQTLEYDTGEEAFEAIFIGGPVALAYHRFDEATRNAAMKEYLESIEPFRNANGYEIPGEFVIGSGVKR